MEEAFAIGNIVWAKMRGYPYWPALIIHPIKPVDTKVWIKDSNKYVLFFGTKDHASINVKNLLPFEEHFENLSQNKKVNFKIALIAVEKFKNALLKPKRSATYAKNRIRHLKNLLCCYSDDAREDFLFGKNVYSPKVKDEKNMNSSSSADLDTSPVKKKQPRSLKIKIENTDGSSSADHDFSSVKKKKPHSPKVKNEKYMNGSSPTDHNMSSVIKQRRSPRIKDKKNTDGSSPTDNNSSSVIKQRRSPRIKDKKNTDGSSPTDNNSSSVIKQRRSPRIKDKKNTDGSSPADHNSSSVNKNQPFSLEVKDEKNMNGSSPADYDMSSIKIKKTCSRKVKNEKNVNGFLPADDDTSSAKKRKTVPQEFALTKIEPRDEALFMPAGDGPSTSKETFGFDIRGNKVSETIEESEPVEEYEQPNLFPILGYVKYKLAAFHPRRNEPKIPIPPPKLELKYLDTPKANENASTKKSNTDSKKRKHTDSTKVVKKLVNVSSPFDYPEVIQKILRRVAGETVTAQDLWRGMRKPFSFKVGFLGMGSMGNGLARALLDFGHHVCIWNRNPQKCIEIMNYGGICLCSPAEVVRRSDVIFCAVRGSKAAAEVFYGGLHVRDGILKGLNEVDASTKGCVMISTIATNTSVMISNDVIRTGARYLEAPILPKAFRNGDGLFFVCAGDRNLFRKLPDCLRCTEAKLYYLSPQVGDALRMKQVYTVYNACSITSFLEILSLAERLGISHDFLEVITRESNLLSPFMGDQFEDIKERNWGTSVTMREIKDNVKHVLQYNLSIQLGQSAATHEVLKLGTRCGHDWLSIASLYEVISRNCTWDR